MVMQNIYGVRGCVHIYMYIYALLCGAKINQQVLSVEQKWQKSYLLSSLTIWKQTRHCLEANHLSLLSHQVELMRRQICHRLQLGGALNGLLSSKRAAECDTEAEVAGNSPTLLNFSPPRVHLCFSPLCVQLCFSPLCVQLCNNGAAAS